VRQGRGQCPKIFLLRIRPATSSNVSMICCANKHACATDWTRRRSRSFRAISVLIGEDESGGAGRSVGAIADDKNHAHGRALREHQVW
jgi:hypothetical protein